MKNPISKFFLFFSLSLFMFSAFAQELKVGSVINDISLKDINNKLVSLQNVNKGKMVLLNLYSPVNGNNSVGYYNEILKIHKQYSNLVFPGNKGFDTYSICFDESIQNFALNMENTDLPYYKFPNNVFEEITVGAGNKFNSPLIDKYKFKGFPTNILLDENGKVLLVNAKTTEIEALLKKKSQGSDKKIANIFAKLLYGDKKNIALAKQKIQLISGSGIVLATAVTDDFGDFAFTQVNVADELKFNVESSEQTKKISEIYVAKQNGLIISTIVKTNSEFNYKLLEKDILMLSDIEQADESSMKIEKFSKSADKEIIIVENIYYPTNEFKILEKSFPKLDMIAEQMKKNKTLKLEIFSHTDAVGNDASNLELSKKRAKEAMDYLVRKGVEVIRIKANGMGETKILNRCANGISCSEKEQELNRRTEFKFIK